MEYNITCKILKKIILLKTKRFNNIYTHISQHITNTDLIICPNFGSIIMPFLPGLKPFITQTTFVSCHYPNCKCSIHIYALSPIPTEQNPISYHPLVAHQQPIYYFTNDSMRVRLLVLATLRESRGFKISTTNKPTHSQQTMIPE